MEKKTLTWRLTCKFRDDETIEDGRLNLESFICERNAWRLYIKEEAIQQWIELHYA